MTTITQRFEKVLYNKFNEGEINYTSYYHLIDEFYVLYNKEYERLMEKEIVGMIYSRLFLAGDCKDAMVHKEQMKKLFTQVSRYMKTRKECYGCYTPITLAGVATYTDGRDDALVLGEESAVDEQFFLEDMGKISKQFNDLHITLQKEIELKSKENDSYHAFSIRKNKYLFAFKLKRNSKYMKDCMHIAFTLKNGMRHLDNMIDLHHKMQGMFIGMKLIED